MLNVIKEIAKTFEKNYTWKTTHIKKKNTLMLKIFKKQLMTKDFLWRLKLHVGNWNEWPLVLRTWFSVLSGGRSGWRQWLDDFILQSRSYRTCEHLLRTSKPTSMQLGKNSPQATGVKRSTLRITKSNAMVKRAQNRSQKSLSERFFKH